MDCKPKLYLHAGSNFEYNTCAADLMLTLFPKLLFNAPNELVLVKICLAICLHSTHTSLARSFDVSCAPSITRSSARRLPRSFTRMLRRSRRRSFERLLVATEASAFEGRRQRRSLLNKCLHAKFSSAEVQEKTCGPPIILVFIPVSSRYHPGSSWSHPNHP